MFCCQNNDKDIESNYFAQNVVIVFKAAKINEEQKEILCLEDEAQ